MAHITMVTLDHYPDDDRIFFKEAQALKNAGYTVSILCVADAKGLIKGDGGYTTLNPHGQLAISRQGIDIYGVKAPAAGLENVLKKGFAGGFVTRFVKSGQALAPDVFHAHEPASLFLAFRMAKQDSRKVVFDSHESWLSGSARDFWVKRKLLPKLRYLITANTMTKGQLMAKNPTMASQVIYNFPEARIFSQPYSNKKFDNPIIAHDGILPFNRGLSLMLDAMALLKAKFPGIKLRIIGEVKGKEWQYLQKQIQQHQLKANVTITGWRPYEEVPLYLADTAIGLILKTPRPLNNVLGGPAIKLFNYFASGMAVVDAGLPESTAFLDAINAGISLRSRTAPALAEALAYLIQSPALMLEYAEKGRNATQTWQWEHEAPKLIRFYQQQVLSKQGDFLIRG